MEEPLGPEVASDLLDLRDKPPEPLAASPQALGVWELAWPTIVSFATQTAVRWADFAMVGSLGTDALAAVGLGGQVYWLVQSVGALVPTGLVAVLARAIGAGDNDLADATLRQGLLLSTAIGLVITFALLPFCDFVIEIYGVEPSVVTYGSAYVFWLLWGTVPMATAMVFGTALRAAGDSRSPLYIGVLTNLVNLGLNWLLIYGNLGFPALGVAGAAIASSISMFLQIGLFLWLWRRGQFILRRGTGSFRPDFALMRRLSIVGYPAAFEGVAFQVGLLLFQRIMSVYGTAAIAAYNVGAQILSLSFLPGIGFAAAAGTLIGQHLGNGSPDAAERSGWRAMVGAIISMSAMGGLVLLFREQLARAFTDDPEVIRLTISFIWILTVVQPMMAVEFAIGGALRGAGDTLFPLIVIFVGLFVCRLIPAVSMVTWWDVTVETVWCALIADWTVKAGMLLVRYRNGKWKELEV
ncbi:MAG: MATE family efflux transporter [Myxococcota bacterium]